VNSAKNALALLAHPDDAEFTCAGTLALLCQRGWRIHIATMTPGQCGSKTLPPEEIAAVRRKEAASAAGILNARYHCLEREDFFVSNDRETKLAAVELVRRVKPDIVFVHSPSDYICDHEEASAIGRDAAFWAGVPNISTPDSEPLLNVPHLYYVDPMEGKDAFGERVVPSLLIDISEVIETKAQMLLRHSSQRDWLMEHHGMDEYTEAMKRMGSDRGDLVGRNFAEGFRQHLGHGYPQDDLLKANLERLAYLPNRSFA